MANFDWLQYIYIYIASTSFFLYQQLVGFKIDGDPSDTLSLANNMVRCETHHYWMFPEQ